MPAICCGLREFAVQGTPNASSIHHPLVSRPHPMYRAQPYLRRPHRRRPLPPTRPPAQALRIRLGVSQTWPRLAQPLLLLRQTPHIHGLCVLTSRAPAPPQSSAPEAVAQDTDGAALHTSGPAASQAAAAPASPSAAKRDKLATTSPSLSQVATPRHTSAGSERTGTAPEGTLAATPRHDHPYSTSSDFTKGDKRVAVTPSAPPMQQPANEPSFAGGNPYASSAKSTVSSPPRSGGNTTYDTHFPKLGSSKTQYDHQAAASGYESAQHSLYGSASEYHGSSHKYDLRSSSEPSAAAQTRRATDARDLKDSVEVETVCKATSAEHATPEQKALCCWFGLAA